MKEAGFAKLFSTRPEMYHFTSRKYFLRHKARTELGICTQGNAVY